MFLKLSNSALRSSGHHAIRHAPHHDPDRDHREHRKHEHEQLPVGHHGKPEIRLIRPPARKPPSHASYSASSTSVIITRLTAWSTQ